MFGITYIGKWEEHQRYGGAQEGGWWYDEGHPTSKYGVPCINIDAVRITLRLPFSKRAIWSMRESLGYNMCHSRLSNAPIIGRIFRWLEDLPYAICRNLNMQERQRREDEERYPYYSVLSNSCTYYSYGMSDTFKLRSYPESRPHYE